MMGHLVFGRYGRDERLALPPAQGWTAPPVASLFARKPAPAR